MRFFFFSSRRRHTRFDCDWSSDVCSSDLEVRYVEETVSLAMRRISVIDVAGGHQPIWNEIRTAGVVMNGEIYNFQAGRNALIAKGDQFETKCDTQGLVDLYGGYGAGWDRALSPMVALS